VDYLLIFEKNGIRKFAGNYSDYLLVKRYQDEEQVQSAQQKISRPKRENKGLSYNEQRELNSLEEQIENIEAELLSLENELTKSGLNPDQYRDIAQRIESLNALHETSFNRWLELSDKQ
jgi:ATP-binding cassette subfamily F protein uup